jgi:HAD superfamily hydrolase (TIGR01509 family)
MNVAALVLDFDGLIIDTETPIYEEWRSVYRSRGFELGLDVWQHSLGTHGGFDPCAHLADLTGATFDHDALRQELRERHHRRCAMQPLLPGVEALVRDARASGLKTAVATSSTREWVEKWLAHHGIRELFDTVCAREDVTRVKPAPDLFLLAAERLGIAPEACLVFEDSPNGVRAARAAGMRCVAVPNATTRTLALPDPDLIVSSLAEQPLAELLERLRARA